jgi:hypothetical protein
MYKNSYGDINMYHEKMTDFGLGILSDSPTFGWIYLQQIAKHAGITKGISKGKDDYYGVVLRDEVPVYSYTMIKYPNNCIRCTKMLANPRVEDSFNPKQLSRLIKFASEVFTIHADEAAKENIAYDLTFVSRHQDDHGFGRLFTRQGWETSELLYQVGTNPDDSDSWKTIFYKGNLSSLCIPSMTNDEYLKKF